MTDLTQAARQALEALEDVCERLAFVCGEKDASAPSAVGRAKAAALRAALEAQQEPLALTMSGHQLKQALQFVEADDSADALDTRACFAMREAGVDQEGEAVPAGLCVWLEEYPGEGSIHLDGTPLNDAHPPAQPQGWVPVTERLPEKHVEVLICFAGQNTLASTGQYTGSDKDVEGWCYPWENRAATDSGDDPVVTHWMPLPEVPAARPQPKEPQA